MGSVPPSSYYIVTRRKQAPFMFQKLPELCMPFGVKRSPAYQFIARLRDFKPHLKDLLIVSSTASSDIGLISRSDQPLSDDDIAKQNTGLFTTTEISDDAKRAEIPLTDASDETSVVGLGIDLSSTDNVADPIPGEDIAESATPLPSLLLLNNDGIVSSWWFVYSDSIRQKVAYSGMSVLSGQVQQPQQAPQQPPQQQQPSFGMSSLLGASKGFGGPSATPAFGSPSILGGGRPSAFGTPSPLGGGPSFGSPSAPKPSFGAPSALGRGTPQFGQSSFGSVNRTPAFGQSTGSGFSSFSTSGGGFGSFANNGGFAGLASSKPSEGLFSKSSGQSPFNFGTNTDTAFSSQKSNVSGGLNTPSQGFVLGSTFKGDGSAVNDAPKPEKPSGLFSLGADMDEMVSTPTKASPPTGAMDDMEDDSAAPQQAPQQQPPQLSGPSLFSFGNQTKAEQAKETSQGDDRSADITPKQDDKKAEDQPLPPEPTSKAVFAPGDTSASSNVSKSSLEDLSEPTPKAQGEPPLPPDFTSVSKKQEKTETVAEEAPLPPEPSLAKAKETSPVTEEAPLPPEPSPAKAKEASPVAEEAPLPPDPLNRQVPEIEKPGVEEKPAEEKPLPDVSPEKHGSEGEESLVEDEDHAETEVNESEQEEEEEEKEEEEGERRSGFSDSGHETPAEEGELKVQSLKTSPDGSFGGLFGNTPKHAFSFPARNAGEAPRSPSPVRKSAPLQPGARLASRKAILSDSAQKHARQEPSPSTIAKEEEARYVAQLKRQVAEEAQSLSDDDEDEQLRADLARPLEPVPTLDPFLPHQDYTGGTSKPGIPGQIEKLYRDINSMVDTLGINSRSLLSYLLYQETANDSDYGKLTEILHGDQPTSISDEKLYLTDIEKLDDFVDGLASSLDQRRVHGVKEKLDQCREILSNDILMLRGQCAGIRKTLDAHTNTISVISASLSAEQVNMQQDLRTSYTAAQAKLAELEQDVSLLRAKIADASQHDGASVVSKSASKKPTVEAVVSTIGTMMNMAESRSSDIDVLEAQMKRLGIDMPGQPLASREGSPLTTPKKTSGLFSGTPDGSLNASARTSKLRNVEGNEDYLINRRASGRWEERTQRKKHLKDNLRHALGAKPKGVRSMDD